MDAPAAGTDLALAAVGFVGACTRGAGLGLGLSCLHSSQSGSRFITTAVHGPDFSGLHWWFCENNAWETWGIVWSNPAYLTLQLTNTAQKQIWGFLLQHLRSRSCPWQGSDNHRAKGRTCSTSSAGPGHHNTSHTSYQGDNGQHILRKEVAGIHTKNSPHTKIIKPMQVTQGCSHIKIVSQDHSR